MSALRLVLLSLVVVAFQTLAVPVYTLGTASPRFALLAVSFVALKASAKEAFTTAVFAGALLDLFSLDAWGTNVAALCVAAYVLERAAAAGWAERIVPRVLLLAAALLLALAARFLILRLSTGSTPPLSLELAVTLYTWVLALPLFAVLERLHPFVRRQAF